LQEAVEGSATRTHWIHVNVEIENRGRVRQDRDKISVATPVLRVDHTLSRHMCSPQSWLCTVRTRSHHPRKLERHASQRRSSPHLCRALTLSSVSPRPVVWSPQSFAVTTYRLHDMTEREHHPCRTPMHIHSTHYQHNNNNPCESAPWTAERLDRSVRRLAARKITIHHRFTRSEAVRAC
jgi:hypothetical protein